MPIMPRSRKINLEKVRASLVAVSQEQLRPDSQGTRQIRQCRESRKGCELRGSRIVFRRHVSDIHREPSEFSLNTNLMDVRGSARHGDNANAHRYRTLECKPQGCSHIGSCRGCSSGLFRRTLKAFGRRS
jgi:hypothetical protein